MATFKDLIQRRQQTRTPASTVEQRAQSLLAAIDAGGIPLNPAIVNDIARKLGLEVSMQAPMDETIARIRSVVNGTAR
ncbi:MAG: hypothetical protein RLZZ369_1530 [Pseudomonadota bacterium]